MASTSRARAGRFLRLRFNSVPTDQPGRYFYLRDRESGDYWSASWQPVGKPLDAYQSVCRHGTAYTVIESRYAGITDRGDLLRAAGPDLRVLAGCSVTNESDRPRRLAVFSYCEFTNQWSTLQDQVNLQYSLFIVKGERTRTGCCASPSMTTSRRSRARAAPTTSACTPGWRWWARRWPATTPAARPSWARTAATTTRWRWSAASAATATPTATTPAAACRPS